MSSAAKGNDDAIPPSDSVVSLKIRQSIEGDPASQAWIISHITPLLLAQANYRLPSKLRSLYDAEDLVQRVWSVALPRLGDLVPRGGRYSPVLIRFLSTTLLQDLQNLIRKHISGRPVAVLPIAENVNDPWDRLSDSVTGALTRVFRKESAGELSTAIEALPSADRELVILRGLEQFSYAALSRKLDEAEATLRVRYHRALHRLESFLPEWVAEELNA